MRVDGRLLPTLAEGDLRAVDVPAGARRVVWAFVPDGVLVGGWISITVFASLLFLPFAIWLEEKHTPRGRARAAARAHYG